MEREKAALKRKLLGLDVEAMKHETAELEALASEREGQKKEHDGWTVWKWIF